jgi:signal-transduction protein with cAMP-binding, CBS, and nucleotidyltransferase domain
MKMLTELARQWRSPVGFLGRWSKSDGRVDLKKGGLLPIVTGARVLALRHGVEALGTENRMRGLVGAGAASEETIERVLSAHETLLGAVLRQQLMDARSGTPLSSRVDVDRLAKPEQQRLKGAVGTIASVVDLVAEGRL